MNSKLSTVFTGVLAALVVVLTLTACETAEELPIDVPESDVLYSDDFSPGNSGSWVTEGDNFGSTAVFDEQLVIDVQQPDTIQYTTLRNSDFDDFELLVQATLLAGDRDSSYGVIFRMLSPNEFYRFEITGEGLYIIERLNADGSWTRFMDDWQQSDFILAGPNTTNWLRIVADRSRLSFYVNDEFLRQVTDSAYSHGAIALDAGTFGQASTQVAFDNLVVVRQ